MAENPSTPATGLPILQFAPFQSLVDEGFWWQLSSLKLDTLRTDESPIPITGFYAPCSHADISNNFTLLAESLPRDPSEQSSQHERSRGNRNRCPVPGTLYNTNTLEGFHALDKNSLLKMEAKKILGDICSGKVEEDGAVLSRFLLISFADLKKHSFHYWFAFPALALHPPAMLISIQPASLAFTLEEAESLSAACNDWRNSSLTADVSFFLVSITPNSRATIRPLKNWEDCQGDGKKLLFGFYDPCHLPSNPGWPLRNFLAFICLRWKMEEVHFFCYREKHGLADLGSSLVGEARVSVPQGSGDPQCVREAVGWERNRGRLASRCISLAGSMDPERLAVSAADLNLKLMRWRALPSLNLDILSTVKCLLLGAGALGCQVARMLMAWGVRKITLLDSGRVAMHNPVRQSLYTFEDCLDGGDLKAVAAARSLKHIFPAVEAEGIALAIPMPGHPIPSQEEAGVLEDCKHLQALITSHDVIFLLTDTRESRWLPTLLCASENKIAITGALGFDSYLVMRHGAGPIISKLDISSGSSAKVEDTTTVVAQMDSLSTYDGDRGRRLGCYFCNDVVAPIDSASNRTLDHQCTVTRPGLAPIASALAVELMAGVLHHPNGIHAPGEIANSIMSSSEQPLGILPHQIRGSLPHLSQLTPIGYSSNSCTACCSAVVSEYRRRGMEFVLQAINLPTYLENVMGVTEPMKSASSFEGDRDNGPDADAVVVGWKDPQCVPKAVGWEPNRGMLAPRLAVSAAGLNLMLMSHTLPSLNLNLLSTIKCLLVGAGTLGCQVARMLMAWGVRKITLLDSGRVSMSNPVRQSLYAFEDCLNRGALKAVAAARSLKRIFPAVEVEGIALAIPMPGHPVSSQEESGVLEDCKHLQTLITSHDVIFLLTDTRESRWLPTLLCASENKIAINAALGFDSYLVMRHGAGPIVSKPDITSASKVEDVSTVVAQMDSLSTKDGDRGRRLGCYFCNDVVAPIDSISNRTLDQQCTVTRPGLAHIASALAVELMVGILHHPNGIHAPGEIADSSTSSGEQPLGILPHQIRGSLSQFSQLTLIGYSSNSCTACCSAVVSEYKRRGMEFVLQAINHPTYLEDLTGLTELKKSASSFEVDWDYESDDAADV